MYRLLLVLAVTVPIAATANEKTVSDSFIKTLPEAVADAALIDLPLELLLYGLGLGTSTRVPVSTIAAAASYSIRKTCNDYQEDEGKKDWRISAACGAVAGALKYTGRSLVLGDFNYLQPVVGAVDAGTYEATSQIRGNYVPAELMAIEGMVSGVQYLQGLAVNGGSFTTLDLAKSLRAGAAVGVLVAGTVYTTLQWYSTPVQNWLISLASSKPLEKAKEEL